MLEPKIRSSAAAAYGVAALCVAGALGARWSLSGVLGGAAPLAFFALAAAGAAFYGGVGPGLAALVTGWLVGEYFFIDPRYTLGPQSLRGWAHGMVFVLQTAAMVWIVEAWKRSRVRARELSSLAETRREQLAAIRREIGEAEARIHELFNSAPVAYVVTDPGGLVQQVNAVAAAMLNETAASLQGRPLAQLLAPEARSAFLARLEGLAQNESGAVEALETTLQPAAGTAFPCSILANRVEDQERGLTGLRWILRDITERKQAEDRILRLNSELEQRVRDRTTALEAANREMEAFSYSVSHDLRAPLRSVVGFSKALMEDYGNKLDAQGLMFLRCSHDAGMRMSRLIEDLIGLSQAARSELNLAEVNLSALAEATLAELRKRDPARDVEVAITPGLLVCGDEGLLRIALENLLGNAWKFTSRKAHARIEVGSLSRESSPVYYVRDNGAGFSMAHSGRLFGVFQRLHLQDEFPGTGIGLATVRRILNRHGGRVWAESKVGEGATFFFTLPPGFPTVTAVEAQAA